MLKVYAADVSGLDPDGNYPLSQYRRKKLEKQKLLSARRLGVGAELLLIKALEKNAPEISLPLHIICGRDGKPKLSCEGLHFNLSHSGVFAACAVSGNPVGLDIQSVREYNEKLGEKYFSPQERAFIVESVDVDHAFTQIWSMKESCVKLLGTGLKMPLASFSLDVNNGSTEINGRKLFLYHCILQGCHLSVCSEDEIDIESINIDMIKLLP